MLEKLVGQGWNKALKPHLSEEYFKELGVFLAEEYDSKIVYPPQRDIFNSFLLTEYDNVNVVILGLDPYIRHGQAYGVSFGIQASCAKIPPSLRNIAREVKNDVYWDVDFEFDYTLQTWGHQGCFMYNTALTVVEGKTGSHLKYWSNFTKGVINALNDKPFCIYLLLGRVAQSYEEYISKADGVHIIKAPHPSAESYAGGKAGFFESKVFSQINFILLTNNKKQINW